MAKGGDNDHTSCGPPVEERLVLIIFLVKNGFLEKKTHPSVHKTVRKLLPLLVHRRFIGNTECSNLIPFDAAGCKPDWRDETSGCKWAPECILSPLNKLRKPHVGPFSWETLPSTSIESTT